jgi:hypothetical protein
MDKKLIQTIARLRRSQPHNADTQAVCDALENQLHCPKCEENKRQVRERVARFRQRQLT